MAEPPAAVAWSSAIRAAEDFEDSAASLLWPAFQSALFHNHSGDTGVLQDKADREARRRRGEYLRLHLGECFCLLSFNTAAAKGSSSFRRGGTRRPAPGCAP